MLRIPNVIQMGMDRVMVPLPTRVETNKPGALPINTKNKKMDRGMAEIPANRHRASSGKKGRKNRINSPMVYFSETR